VSETTWSDTEKNIVKETLKRAYERETLALIEKIREQASLITELDDVWCLHDFLSTRRHEIDGKYDYRDSVLIFVLAQLLKERWLQLNELEGLAQDKLAKIAALARM
jgi:hypothetical protein